MTHITTDVGDCVPWCPDCGPVCKHGHNSYTCSECLYEEMWERPIVPSIHRAVYDALRSVMEVEWEAPVVIRLVRLAVLAWERGAKKSLEQAEALDRAVADLRKATTTVFVMNKEGE